MKKRLLIVDGWDIAVDDDYVNSLDSKINDVKITLGISNNESEDVMNVSNLSLIDKYDSHDTNFFLRLKGLGKRQIETKLVSSWLYHIFSSSFSIGK